MLYIYMYSLYIDARSQAKTLHVQDGAEAETVLKEGKDSTRYLEGNMTAYSRNVASSQSCLFLATGFLFFAEKSLKKELIL